MLPRVPPPTRSDSASHARRNTGTLTNAERLSEGRRLFPRSDRRISIVGRGHVFMVLVAILCGLGGGGGAVALRALILFIQGLFFGRGLHPLGLFEQATWSWRMVAPAMGGLVVGPLVYFCAREAKGHGVPEVMETIILRGGAIRPRVVIVKALASAISIGSGGSVGREGPIVQIGATLGSTIGNVLGVTANQLRTLVGCGAAAGIAATFNAPIAGALFAVEILLGDFRVPQFSPIVISSVVATVVSRHFAGNFPVFVVSTYDLVSPFEFSLYPLAGVAAGLVALAFISVLYRSEEVFERLRVPEYLKAALGGLCVGAVGIWLPQVFGVGYDSINDALTGGLPLTLLGILIVGKMLATSLTLASGGSGGVFAPALFLGAMTGGAVGTIIHHSRDQGRLVGSIHRQAVINARDRELLRRDLVGAFSSPARVVGKGHKIDVGDGYVVEEIRAPRTLVDRAMRELDLPGRYGIQVIFIRSRTGRNGAHLRVAGADDRVRTDDSLVVAGPKQAIGKLERL